MKTCRGVLRLWCFRCAMAMIWTAIICINFPGIIKKQNKLSSEQLVNFAQQKTSIHPQKENRIDTQQETTIKSSSTNSVNMTAFASMLRKHSSEDKWIMLTLIDQGCLDMAINFYMTSLLRFNIKNYLFIGSDEATCNEISFHGINCYLYKTDKDAGKSSVYHSQDFRRKMNIRTYLIVDALNLGYNVLHSDVDMTFLQNPFADLDYNSDTYDIAPLWDNSAFNAGFLFIRNSTPSQELYNISRQIADSNPFSDDQETLNNAIKTSKKKHGLKLHLLSKNKYLCGKSYWETGQRYFADDNPCKDCVVVHNNWIVSMEAKTYRLRELHWWMYDKDQYYSSTTRKYLYFDNPGKFHNQVDFKKYEINALKNALAIGKILNRTVILPKFHCGKKFTKCNILNLLLLRNFQKLFPNYRESTFLDHPIVANNVKNSFVSNTNKVHLIASDKEANLAYASDKVTILTPKDVKTGATDQEIILWLNANKAPVLRFHSLYNAFCCFTHNNTNTEFNANAKVALKHSDYRQFGKA